MDTDGQFPDPESSLWAHIAADLRHERLKRGLSLAQLGRILKMQRQGVNAREKGRRKVTEKDAEILDREWDTGGRFTRAVRFARRGHNPEWQREHLEYEAGAAVIRLFGALWIPGLLQTPDYAQAVYATAGIADFDAMVERRTRRQHILIRDQPTQLWAILDEATIRRPVGTDTEMAAQLRYILDMAERANISVRVMPFAARAHMGQDGAFKLMYSAPGLPEVGFIEAPHGGRLLVEAGDVARLNWRYERISAKALPEDQSLGLIREAMEGLS